MALFGKKKEVEKKSSPEISTQVETKEDKKNEVSTQATTKSVISQKVSVGRDLASVIKRPRITEKAVLKTDQNVHTFEVRSDATKYDVRDAVKEMFGVTPIKVNTVNKKTRHYTSRMRGRDMTDRQTKKAYVYLKEGDHIDLV